MGPFDEYQNDREGLAGWFQDHFSWILLNAGFVLIGTPGGFLAAIVLVPVALVLVLIYYVFKAVDLMFRATMYALVPRQGMRFRWWINSLCTTAVFSLIAFVVINFMFGFFVVAGFFALNIGSALFGEKLTFDLGGFFVAIMPTLSSDASFIQKFVSFAVIDLNGNVWYQIFRGFVELIVALLILVHCGDIGGRRYNLKTGEIEGSMDFGDFMANHKTTLLAGEEKLFEIAPWLQRFELEFPPIPEEPPHNRKARKAWEAERRRLQEAAAGYQSGTTSTISNKIDYGMNKFEIAQNDGGLDRIEPQ